MAWLFVPGVEGSSLGSGLPSVPPIDPSVTWRGKRFLPRSWRRVWRTAPWIRRLCGLILKASILARGVAAWISSLPASRASPSLSRDAAGASPTSDGSGLPWRHCFAVYSRRSSSWKTPLSSSTRASPQSSPTWPHAGGMRSGMCFRRPRAERRTSAKGFSSWLPTPTVTRNGGNRGGGSSRTGPYRRSLDTMASTGLWPTPGANPRDATARRYRRGNPNLAASVQARQGRWPTPQAKDWRSGKVSAQTRNRNSRPLNEAVHWATPTMHGNWNRKGASATSCDGLATQAGGQLNPAWLEWLMGWPIGWTESEHSATESYRRWLAAHSGPSPKDSPSETP